MVWRLPGTGHLMAGTPGAQFPRRRLAGGTGTSRCNLAAVDVGMRDARNPRQPGILPDCASL